MNYQKTVSNVNLASYAGDWYVQATRPTVFEKDVYNGLENYKIEGDKIDITFSYNKGGFDGEKKVVKQKGTVYNQKTNAHWKVSPFWPLKFDFLVIALADDYSWTAVGVPSTKYLWVMTRKKTVAKDQVDEMLQSIASKGYPINDIVYISHQ